MSSALTKAYLKSNALSCRPVVGRSEASEEHDLIAKYCEHLHSRKSGPENNLDVSDERLDDTSFERQDLIQVEDMSLLYEVVSRFRTPFI